MNVRRSCPVGLQSDTERRPDCADEQGRFEPRTDEPRHGFAPPQQDAHRREPREKRCGGAERDAGHAEPFAQFVRQGRVRNQLRDIGLDAGKLAAADEDEVQQGHSERLERHDGGIPRQVAADVVGDLFARSHERKVVVPAAVDRRAEDERQQDGCGQALERDLRAAPLLASARGELVEGRHAGGQQPGEERGCREDGHQQVHRAERGLPDDAPGDDAVRQHQEIVGKDDDGRRSEMSKDIHAWIIPNRGGTCNRGRFPRPICLRGRHYGIIHPNETIV